MRTVRCILLAVVVAALPRTVGAFSVLAHQAVLDRCWGPAVVPALRERFPGATDDALERAHAFAYGGSLIPDLGYFPLGNLVFTDLLHYLRSGAFSAALLHDAHTVDEYAFASGALSPWVSDDVGHPEATNRAVAVIYPKLREKYGDSVTYADDHTAHLATDPWYGYQPRAA